MKPHYVIGIKIPRDVADKLATERDGWKLQSHKSQTHAEDMHITLLFIGEDIHNELGKIQKLLANVKQKVFKIEITSIKTFGNPTTPRIVYAALETSQELNELQQQVHNSLETLKVKADPKKFVPHITLASKWAGGKPEKLYFSIASISFEVMEFSLFRITPKEIPRYQKVVNYPLEK